MSIQVITELTPATCGHFHSGSSKVFSGGKGISRVEADTAGGLIIGPGSQNVFVEGYKASIAFDAISTHGDSPHSGARTLPSPDTKVFAGTGFAGDQFSTGFAPKPDIRTISFTTNYDQNSGGFISLNTSGQPSWPVQNMYRACKACNPGPDTCVNSGSYPSPPNVIFTTVVKNVGLAASQEFSIGFWKFDESFATAPNEAILTVDAAESFYPSARLQDEFRVPVLQPTQEYEVSFEWSEVYRPNNDYVFGIYADIRGESTEPDEKNSAPSIYIRCRGGC